MTAVALGPKMWLLNTPANTTLLLIEVHHKILAVREIIGPVPA